MIGKLILAVVVGVVVFLVCVLFGSLLTNLAVSWAVSIGDFLKTYASLIGLLAALWQFFAGFSITKRL